MFLKVRDACGALFPMVCAILVGGCTIYEGDTKPPLSAAGLIATSPSHYSTQKARYLGEKYQKNLEHLIEMITSNPKTSKLQFANNLASSGGIGFFTHSAVKAPDERFLEVVLGTEENLEGGEYSAKVTRLFSLYGRELLVILASDIGIYNDREVSGYGLSFTWRSWRSRTKTERAIIYFSKEKVRAFLRQDINDNTLLDEAVIFVMEPEGQANLLSSHAQEPAPDVRAPIKEQLLLPDPAKEEPEVKAVAEKPVISTEPITAGKSSVGEKESRVAGSKNKSAPKPLTPDLALKTKEEIVQDGKIAPVVGGRAEAVGTASATESGDQSGRNSTPGRGVIEIMRSNPRALKSSQPQVRAEPVQAKLQHQKSELNTRESSSLVEVIKEKDESELRLDLRDSQPPARMEESRPNGASKPELGLHALPAPESTEVSPSLAKAPKPGSEVERLGDRTSMAAISPKSAHSETAVPAPITPSGLQNAEADSVEPRSVIAHAKPMENILEAKSFVKPAPKSLEGYIIQVPFKDRSEARSWADIFEQRGYAVSITEAGGGESLRVRIGNFRFRDDAERQLKSIREDGLMGIVLNFPQAYRPEVRSSLP